MVVKKSVTIDLFVCDFCGSVFTDKTSARSNGCCKAEPKKRFSVGDIVHATFRVGAGIEDVGSYSCKGEIVAIEKPLSSFNPKNIKPGKMGGYNNGRISFQARVNKHQWMLRIEAIEKHPNPERFLAPAYCSQNEVTRIAGKKK